MNNVWIFNHYATVMYKNKGGRHYWFAENLKKKGIKTTIFAANTYHDSEDIVEIKKGKHSLRNTNGIPFVFVKTMAYKGNSLGRILNMLFYFINLFFVTKSYLKDNKKPEAIIASSVHPLTMIAGIKIAKKLSIPCICEVRDLWPEAIFFFKKAKEDSLLGKLLIKGEYWIYKNADALVFTKEGDTDYIKEKKWDIESGGEIDLKKTFYINNGLNINEFKSNIQKYAFHDPDLSNDKFKVTYTGTIRPVNDVQKIIDTAIELKNETDIQFLIYGEGSEKEKLKIEVEKNFLNNVKFKGKVEKHFIPFILSKSSINLLNYSSDKYNWNRGNSSNKLFEYMASGKPIISTVKMGYSIIKKYNCGVELQEDTAKELSKEILKIKNLKKEELQLMGENAESAAHYFDFTLLTEKLIQVLNYVERVDC